MRTLHRLGPSLLALLFGVFESGCAPEDPTPTPHALFLISVDTLRADRLSCYGYTRHETPRIDALAARGVRFDRAHAVASWTVPSIGSIFTSRLPRELGLMERSGDLPSTPFALRPQYRLSLPPEPPHLAEHLRNAGFRTAAFVNQPMLGRHSGFGRGFEEWFDVVGRGEVRRTSSQAEVETPSWEDTPYAWENDAALVERLRRWLEGIAPGERVFVWLHLLTPHAPYLPPPRFAPEVPAGPLSPAAYDGEVRAADALAGRALDAIDSRLGPGRAFIVFTADHGEALGEHGEIGHGQSLHREITDIPLILAGPGIPMGLTVDANARALDIAPTLLDFAGVDATAIESSGRSLRPLFEGATESRVVYAEGMLYGPSESSLLSDGYKLLVEPVSGRSELYSVRDDPLERHDLSEHEPDRMRALRGRLDAIRREIETAHSQRDPVPLSLEDLEALRALGYVDPVHAPESGPRSPATH
jgi:arylsulfatase A-like enzyme